MQSAPTHGSEKIKRNSDDRTQPSCEESLCENTHTMTRKIDPAVEQ